MFLLIMCLLEIIILLSKIKDLLRIKKIPNQDTIPYEVKSILNEFNIDAPIYINEKEVFSLHGEYRLDYISLSKPFLDTQFYFLLGFNTLEDFREAKKFVLMHEYMHYKNDFYKLIIKELMISIVAIYFWYDFTLLSLSYFVISLIIHNMISYRMEECADIEAIKRLGNSYGAECYFKSLLQMNQKIRNFNCWAKLVIFPSGNMIWDFNHPSLTERLQYCEQY